jgi:hypothetical protein
VAVSRTGDADCGAHRRPDSLWRVMGRSGARSRAE